jgi:hypothetical protein
VIGIKLTNRKGKVVAAFMVALEDEIVAISSAGVTIRMGVATSARRAATRPGQGHEPRRRSDGRIVALILASED